MSKFIAKQSKAKEAPLQQKPKNPNLDLGNEGIKRSNTMKPKSGMKI